MDDGLSCKEEGLFASVTFAMDSKPNAPSHFTTDDVMLFSFILKLESAVCLDNAVR